MKDRSCKTPRWRMLKAQLNNLSSIEFLKKINTTENIVVIDVRTPEEFSKRHLKNAINIDFLASDCWSRIEKLSPSKTFFVYCRSGRRSIRICTLMKNGGFDNSRIFNLDEGLRNWDEKFWLFVE